MTPVSIKNSMPDNRQLVGDEKQVVAINVIPESPKPYGVVIPVFLTDAS